MQKFTILDWEPEDHQPIPNPLDALEAISNMRVDENTDHAQLSALCIAIAKAAILNP